MSEQTGTDDRADEATRYEDEYGPYQRYTPPTPSADPPATIKPTLKLSEPTPRPSRAWPLAARLAVAVLIIGLATVTALSLMSIRTMAVRSNQASQQAAAEAVSLAAMGRVLSAVQAKVAEPAKVYRPPAIYQHYGLCVSFDRNSGNGDLVDVNLTAPVMVAGQYSCGQGTFVSVVPAP